MKKLAFLLAAAAAFGAAPFTARLGPVAGSLALIALGIALACAASGGLGALAAAGGSLGAFAAGLLAPSSAALAGAALIGLCFAERTTRVRTRNARLAHAGVALAGGGIAGAVSASFAGSPAGVLAVALVVASVLASLPLLVEADDPLAHALDGAAREVSELVRALLHEGAELRRAADPALLDRKAARQVQTTWASLLRVAEARVRLERAAGRGPGDGERTSPQARVVIETLDRRIAEHVAGLGRALTAADTARAAEVSLDDTALRGVETMGDSFEEVSKAIVDQV
jgi:hypothetical protein